MARSATGRVTHIRVASDNDAVLYQLGKPIEYIPRCNEYRQFSIHLKKTGVMAVYMALLAAIQQGYPVTVEGLINCSNVWKPEAVRTITNNLQSAVAMANGLNFAWISVFLNDFPRLLIRINAAARTTPYI